MYKFPFEPVLNHRKSVEETLQKEVAIYKKLLAEEKQRLNAYKKIKTKVICELREKESDISTSSELLIYVGFLDCLSRDLKRQSERVVEIERSYENKREDLIAAMKNRKTMDKLKDKGEKAHKHYLNQNDQKLMDEVAINRFSRSM